MDTESNIEILAKSSSGNPYKVLFTIEENSISAFCSCPAGIHRKLCKHITRIMNGEDSILFDSNQKQELAKIVSLLRNTKIPSLISDLRESEIFLENAQKVVKKAKKIIEKEILKK